MEKYLYGRGAGKVELVSVDDSESEIKNKVNKSDMIYLAGGDAECLLRRLKEKNILLLLKEYHGIIYGNSAGAIALCGNNNPVEREGKSKLEIIKCLGLVDFSVAVHYYSKYDNDLLKLSKNGKIFAITEPSTLVFDGKNFESIGKVYLFSNKLKSKLS